MGCFRVTILLDKTARFPTDRELTFEVECFRDQIDKLIDLIGENNLDIEEL
jgi:hypothetical protein